MELINCPRCGPQPRGNFGINNQKKSGLQVLCKSCQSKNTRSWYAENREQQRANIKRNKIANRLIVRRKVAEYLLTHPCVDCGQTDIIVLEFDHVAGDKIDTITMLMQRNSSWEKISNEIKKCVVRCANCHRRKTASEGNHWKVLLLKELVGPVGLEPTLGFLPLIKSQVSASNSSTTP